MVTVTIAIMPIVSTKDDFYRSPRLGSSLKKYTIVKMNKMIHKKTGASFLVVCVIYVSLVYTDSKKTASCLLP